MDDVLIVGAGLAGLCCGVRLREIGKSFHVLEASDAVGGRVRTDLVDGFRLDRGFQVLLTAYPEFQRVCDAKPLDLKPFTRGAIIRIGGKFHRFTDPRRDPLHALTTLFGPVGQFADKYRILPLEKMVRAGKVEDQFQKPEGLTLDFLRWGGRFSDAMIDRFFRPFFGGIFLERELVTSSRMFRFVFRMFAEGETVVPAAGMSAIPEQIVTRLSPNTIRLNAPVERVEPGRVTLRSGETLAAKAVVVATDSTTATRLLGSAVKDPGWRAVTCLYFAADASPVGEPTLVLNADEPGPINNFAVMSDVAPSYAPAGQSLLSASVLGDPADDDATLEAKVREQLAAWYGPTAKHWRHLRTYRIKQALPDQTAPALDVPERPVKVADGLYVCGDHRDNASINGAMTSGWRTAQAVAEGLL
ncbi:MAG: NAD(P)/FAD-dependent oxidoreductase [Gemmataceae bacterium]